MRKIALIAIASIVAATSAASTASAALSDREGAVWRQHDVVQVAARGGDKAGRNDGGRKDSGRNARDKNGGKVIWRLRDGKQRPFFLFRGRGDCKTEAIQVRDADGTSRIRSKWVCN